jgi:hypothetical protein
MMGLKEYFDRTTGKGILATADDTGKVDTALYAKPYLINDKTIVFIMADRLSHANLKTNPHAAYLYLEDGPVLRGRRLVLTKDREEKNLELIDELLRLRRYISQDRLYDEDSFLVYFVVDKVLPLTMADLHVGPAAGTGTPRD